MQALLKPSRLFLRGGSSASDMVGRVRFWAEAWVKEEIAVHLSGNLPRNSSLLLFKNRRGGWVIPSHVSSEAKCGELPGCTMRGRRSGSTPGGLIWSRSPKLNPEAARCNAVKPEYSQSPLLYVLLIHLYHVRVQHGYVLSWASVKTDWFSHSLLIISVA